MAHFEVRGKGLHIELKGLSTWPIPIERSFDMAHFEVRGKGLHMILKIRLVSSVRQESKKGKARCVDSADTVCVQEFPVHLNVDGFRVLPADFLSPRLKSFPASMVSAPATHQI